MVKQYVDITLTLTSKPADYVCENWIKMSQALVPTIPDSDVLEAKRG